MLLIPINLMHRGLAAADMGMIVEEHVRVSAVLHTVDLQLDPVPGFEYVSQGKELYRIFINLPRNNGLRTCMGMPGGIGLGLTFIHCPMGGFEVDRP